jgi:integrase
MPEVFRLHPQTIELLQQMKPHGRELLFPWPWTNLARTLYPQFGAILRAAGLPDTARDKFHKIRRTSATYLADVAGEVEAQKHMGHSTVGLTIKYYIDPTKLTRRINAADVIQRPDWGRIA